MVQFKNQSTHHIFCTSQDTLSNQHLIITILAIMFAKIQSLALVVFALGIASAAPTHPTGTNPEYPSKTYTEPKVTHSVVVGRGGLKFDPDNIVAKTGEVVEFHFTPRNHSVVESSFGKPCQPKDSSSFFSGFFPVTEGQSAEVFQIVVKDENTPIWFYCAQNVGAHCQNGMTGVINQRFNSNATLSAHRNLARARVAPSEVQSQIQGGARIANPNPLSGF
ncbi:Cupredoxin [Immersiella caudata]|uniref:Cupredoxin n=1 Tax=Immersiella caudata TaxID=314043 RepID=A0AA39WG08_9PEZI|nr:Cupredoxin [Immersiella caudata]